MNRWYKVVLLIAVLAVGAVGAWGYDQSRARRGMEIFLSNRFRQAFYDTLAHVQNVEVLLGKTRAAGAPPQEIALLADLWQQAMQAEASVTQLPVDPVVVSRTAKFLSQTGDLASTLLRETAVGEDALAEHREDLDRLYTQAASLNRELRALERQVRERGADFLDIAAGLRARAGVRKPSVPVPGENAFRAINREMQQQPTLIYDGPFSDHLERQKPRGLTGSTVSQDEASRRALAFVDRREGLAYTARPLGVTRGRIPAYRIEVAGKKAGTTETVYVDVSRQGGHVIQSVTVRPLGSPRVDVDRARKKAQDFLAGRLKGEFTPTYHLVQNNQVVFTFAGMQDGVVVYPDQVKVAVALDHNQVVGFEAQGYYMEHHARRIPKPALTQAEAQKRLSPRLRVEKGRLALIPTDGGRELLAYEFRARLDRDTYLVYINAANGREEKILKLVPTANGTLTI
ncbi:MAG: putative membrane protein [Clostridia bacterium 62_21]|nr:MAG: putative membrane protein [Clostridia bacterium 62_21]